VSRRTDTMRSLRAVPTSEASVAAAETEHTVWQALAQGRVGHILYLLETQPRAVAERVSGSPRPKGVQEGADRTLRAANLALQAPLTPAGPAREAVLRHMVRHVQGAAWAKDLARQLTDAILAGQAPVLPQAPDTGDLIDF
jgi:hypothetical protein